MVNLPKEIMCWYGQWPLSWAGTWATTRHPEDAVAYVPKAELQALRMELSETKKEITDMETRALEAEVERDEWKRQAIYHISEHGKRVNELRQMRHAAKAEALREAAELVTREGFGAVYDKILALIPDQHKETEK